MKIKVSFNLPTADFKKSEFKELPVEMHIPESMVVSGNIEYSVSIPDYMFNELANTEDKFKTEYDQNNREISGLFSERTVTRKFKKTQTSVLVRSLQDYISSLTQFINEKHSIETATMKKKLFISFKHSEVHTTNGLNSAYTGKSIQQSFKYFVGYEVMTTKFKELKDWGNTEHKKKYISKILYAAPGSSIRKNDTGFKEKEDLFLPLPSYCQSEKDFENQYSILDWTEEREDFCKKVQEKFVKVNEELDSFLKNLDDNKMEMLMSNAGLKMLDK
jgi:hypothetical protein